MNNAQTYCIFCADAENAHISQVGVFICDKDIDNGDIWTKEAVISAIRQGQTFITIFLDDNGQRIPGSVVRVIKGKSGEYIRTEPDDIEEDNLGDLPSCLEFVEFAP